MMILIVIWPGFSLTLDLFLKDDQSEASIFKSDAISVYQEGGKLEIEAIAG